MAKVNCWEFKQCGRQPGGEKVAEFGVCPAAVEKRLDDVNHGQAAGRCCWALTGTLCGGKVQGSFAMKLGNCLKCTFFTTVRQEEGTDYAASTQILKILHDGGR